MVTEAEGVQLQELKDWNKVLLPCLLRAKESLMGLLEVPLPVLVQQVQEPNRVSGPQIEKQPHYEEVVPVDSRLLHRECSLIRQGLYGISVRVDDIRSQRRKHFLIHKGMLLRRERVLPILDGRNWNAGVFIVVVFSRVVSNGLNLEEQSPAFIDIGESAFSLPISYYLPPN